jgi:hypothetical protein
VPQINVVHRGPVNGVVRLASVPGARVIELPEVLNHAWARIGSLSSRVGFGRRLLVGITELGHTAAFRIRGHTNK